jgi:hypothetical protein
MSRIISHQSGLGTPDEVLGDGDGTDGGGGEKGMRGMGLAEIGAQKNTVAVCLRRLALPKPGIRRNSDLLTPQGKDLNPWYLKTGLTATAMSILTRSGSLSSRCR